SNISGVAPIARNRGGAAVRGHKPTVTRHEGDKTGVPQDDQSSQLICDCDTSGARPSPKMRSMPAPVRHQGSLDRKVGLIRKGQDIPLQTLRSRAEVYFQTPLRLLLTQPLFPSSSLGTRVFTL